MHDSRLKGVSAIESVQGLPWPEPMQIGVGGAHTKRCKGCMETKFGCTQNRKPIVVMVMKRERKSDYGYGN